jgi:hypothetical protein
MSADLADDKLASSCIRPARHVGAFRCQRDRHRTRVRGRRPCRRRNRVRAWCCRGRADVGADRHGGGQLSAGEVMKKGDVIAIGLVFILLLAAIALGSVIGRLL